LKPENSEKHKVSESVFNILKLFQNIEFKSLLHTFLCTSLSEQVEWGWHAVSSPTEARLVLDLRGSTTLGRTQKLDSQACGTPHQQTRGVWSVAR